MGAPDCHRCRGASAFSWPGAAPEKPPKLVGCLKECHDMSWIAGSSSIPSYLIPISRYKCHKWCHSDLVVRCRCLKGLVCKWLYIFTGFYRARCININCLNITCLDDQLAHKRRCWISLKLAVDHYTTTNEHQRLKCVDLTGNDHLPGYSGWVGDPHPPEMMIETSLGSHQTSPFLGRVTHRLVGVTEGRQLITMREQLLRPRLTEAHGEVKSPKSPWISWHRMPQWQMTDVLGQTCL